MINAKTFNFHDISKDKKIITFFFFQAEGEPIPNVRWYVDKTIKEEEDEQIEIMKFSNSKSKMQANRRNVQDGDLTNPSPSSSPFLVEETSSADIYSLDNGKFNN